MDGQARARYLHDPCADNSEFALADLLVDIQWLIESMINGSNLLRKISDIYNLALLAKRGYQI